MEVENTTGFIPLGIFFLLVAIALILLLPKKHLTIPIFATACYMTLGQKITILGFNFTLIRIVALACWARLLIKGELGLSALHINTIDKLFLWWIFSNLTIYTLLRWTGGAFINRLGFIYNAAGTYFLFKYLIRDLDDINRVFKQLAIIIFPLAILMLVESQTGRNLFYSLGGVEEYPGMRGGWVRCSGAFTSPILAGTLGATLVPLFVSMWFNPSVRKLFCVIGVISSTIIMTTSGSSGPVMAYGVGVIGMVMIPLRRYIRVLRWGLVLALIFLVIIMKAPIWYLIARLSGVIGGGGWHRSYLIEQFVNHFDEWWLLGTAYTAHWMPNVLEVDPNSADITNQYIVQAVNGGLVTLILFISMIVYCFKAVGRTIQDGGMQSFNLMFTLWSMGVTLLLHVISFFSVSYFDQMYLFWYLLLAMISSVSDLKGKESKNQIVAGEKY